MKNMDNEVSTNDLRESLTEIEQDATPHLDLMISEDNLKEVLKKCKPDWNLEVLTMETSPKSENRGLVNTMITCFVDSKDDAVMMRIYNAKFGEFFTRDGEVKAIKLVRKRYNFVPLVLATYKNGFCYEYIKGAILSPARIREEPVWRLIADELGKLHAIPLPDNISETMMAKFHMTTEGFNGLPYEVTIKDPVNNAIFQKEFLQGEEMLLKLSKLIEIVKTFDCKKVLTHGDFRAENLVLNEGEGLVTFVDFEAAGSALQIMDIAYHFWRFAGVSNPDFSLIPDKDFQKKWIRVYLESYYLATNNGRETEITENEVETLYVQVQYYYLLLQLQTAKAAATVDQFDLDDLQMDMFGMCHAAMKEYRRMEDSIMSLKLPSEESS